MPRSVTFPAIEIEQPIGKFYVGVMDHQVLTEIAFADVRQMSERKDEYLGIQRRVNPVRIEEIRAYTKTKDATFPTSIVLAVEGKCATWDERKSMMTLSEYIGDTPDDPEDPSVPYDKIAKILDGQHRIEGLIGYKRSNLSAECCHFCGHGHRGAGQHIRHRKSGSNQG